MSRKPYDQLPLRCQLLWPWFGPPWYEQVEDLVEDLDAVLVLVHHPLQAADLAFDAAKPSLDRLLLLAVAGHEANIPYRGKVRI